MTQPLTIITRALRAIGAQASGETVPPQIANDCFDMLNEMVDAWSTQKAMIFCIQEVIHELTASQYVYTIGPGGMVGGSFTGSISGTTLTVSALASGAISVGQTISGAAAGTAITSLGTALGGNGTSALGTYNLNISQTLGSSALTSSAVRPLRINSAIVRVVNSISGTLDYPVAMLNVESYERIGIKTLPGPWPKAVYYQPSEPVGVLNYWPNPSSGEVHLFCDAILNRFQTLTDTITLPQGYEMALRWGLAELLMPEFPVAAGASAEVRALVPKYASDARAMLKRINMQPPPAATFDDLLAARIGRDAGFIMNGGFR